MTHPLFFRVQAACSPRRALKRTGKPYDFGQRPRSSQGEKTDGYVTRKQDGVVATVIQPETASSGAPIEAGEKA
jgi:hypothetical protein